MHGYLWRFRFCFRLIFVMAWLAHENLTPSAEIFDHHAVVSVEAHASEVGREVLRQGGNAVDAAVATAFALSVTHPGAGNLGGGGFILAYLAETGQVRSFDFREMAPSAAAERMYLDAAGNLVPGHRMGPKAAGVPGTVRGLALAHSSCGKLPWATLVAPSVKLARDGFPVSASLARSLNSELGTESVLLGQALPAEGKPPGLWLFPASVKAFGRPDKEPWLPGDLLVQNDLADTLERISNRGPDEFYTGKTADLIVADSLKQGGLISREDLKSYRAHERPPIHFSFRDHEVYSMGPPSSGGVVLAIELQILQTFNLRQDGPSHPRTLHRVAEAMRRAFAVRALELGDPDFSAIPTERLSSASFAAELAQSIGEKATPSASLAPFEIAQEPGPHTTHLSVVDSQGNGVALTYTLEDTYGSRSVVEGAGFLLNNEMGDFNLIPGRTDTQGRIGTLPNQVAPGKRMLSSQTPTIVLYKDRLRVVTGSPGGRTIPNTVLWILLQLIEFSQVPELAVSSPRTHQAWFPDVFLVEGDSWPPATLDELRNWGHRVEKKPVQGDAHTIVISHENREIHAVRDPRSSTSRAAGD